MTNEQLEQLLEQHKEELEKKDETISLIQADMHDFCHDLTKLYTKVEAIIENENGEYNEAQKQIVYYEGKMSVIVSVINELKLKGLWT